MSISERTERIRQEYLNNKPSISCLRAKIWTKSHKETEGEPICIRRAKAFAEACDQLPALIFPDELIVGTAGEFRRTAILTPEFSWMWVDKENFSFKHLPAHETLLKFLSRLFL